MRAQTGVACWHIPRRCPSFLAAAASPSALHCPTSLFHSQLHRLLSYPHVKQLRVSLSTPQRHSPAAQRPCRAPCVVLLCVRTVCCRLCVRALRCRGLSSVRLSSSSVCLSAGSFGCFGSFFAPSRTNRHTAHPSDRRSDSTHTAHRSIGFLFPSSLLSLFPLLFAPGCRLRRRTADSACRSVAAAAARPDTGPRPSTSVSAARGCIPKRRIPMQMETTHPMTRSCPVAAAVAVEAS